MSDNQLGPLEVVCDAPPYNIVRACRMIKLRTPEDVRWLRLKNFQKIQRQAGYCSCGKEMPTMTRYIFTLVSGEETAYFVSQCNYCFAIYWEPSST